MPHCISLSLDLAVERALPTISVCLDNDVLDWHSLTPEDYTNIERHGQIGLFLISLLHFLVKNTCKYAGNNT